MRVRLGAFSVCLALALFATPVAAKATRGAELHLATVPARLVPGVVFLKIDGLSQDLLQRASRGDARALTAVNDALARIDDETGVGLSFVRHLPVGWASYAVTTLNDEASEDETLHVARALRGQAGIKNSDVNWWKRTLRAANDEFSGYQWMLDHINAYAAWDMQTGSSAARVGVVDTGTIRGHEDLSGKDAAGFDFISYTEVSNDGDGRDTQYEDAGDSDNSFHGTHVAGTILANGNNGTGIAGVSWGARLVTARALGFGGGGNDDIMQALAWLAGDTGSEAPGLSAANRPRVVNMSLGAANQCSGFEQEVIDWVADQGVIVVAAAGNDGGSVNSPANCAGVVSVGATDSNGSLASYSSFGSEIDVVAPGGEMVNAYEDGVLSLYANFNDGNPPYTFYQGTSMAAPHVAGVVSLMLDVNSSLDAADVISIFASTGSDSCSGCQGKPFLVADQALIAAGAVPPDEPPPDEPPPDDPPPVEPPPGGGTAGSGECDLLRGNLDCPDHQGCLPSDASTLGGSCIVGVDGDTGIGGLCDDDDECSTGLCVKGVCSTECEPDGDCRDGYECDDDGIPGGLCEPESCRDEDADFCERGWSCQYSPDENYVCAAGDANFLSCGHTRPTEGAPTAALMALMVSLGALVRRRPRSGIARS